VFEVKFNCPVCGYRAMPYPAVPYNICPCCGTEFGVDDHLLTIPQLRRSWISRGAPWFDDITSPPANWSPSLQLIQSGYGGDLVANNTSVAGTERDNVSIVDRSFWFEPDLSRIKVA
jgi:hypothetical protein